MKAIITIAATILLLFVLGAPRLYGNDKLTLRGNFKDKSGEMLPRVTVVIKDNTGNLIAYTIGDNSGMFSLEYTPTSSNDSIAFSAIGYRSITLPVGKFRSGSTVIMEEEALKLKEVTVRVPPISSRGDTLTYNVASFRTASDRTIEDIIRKLPGINVANDGRISYNGEAINKFYIEGLDLLAGRYTLASRNISPDDVVAVNVYENHQPIRVLKDVQFSKYAALNLKLKKKSMLRPVGNVKGGGGTDIDGSGLWLGELFGMLIAPKMQTIITAKGNNAGTSYVNETRSMIESEMSGNTPAYDIYPLTPFGSAKIPSYRFYRNRSFSGSVNTISKLSEFTNLNVTADYTDEKNTYDNTQSITYATGPDGTVIIREDADNNLHPREAKVSLRLENNADRRYLSDKLTFVGHFNSNRYDVANEQAYIQRVTTRDYNLRNTFNGTFRVGGIMLDFKSDTQLGTTPFNRHTALCDNEPMISQTVKGLTLRNSETLGYSWFLTSDSHIALKSKFDFRYDRFRSADNMSRDADPGNDVNGHDITLTIEPSYQNKFAEQFTFNLSVPLVFSWLDFTDATTDKSNATDRFNIDFRTSLRYSTPSRTSISLTLGRQNFLGGISDYIIHPLYITFRQRTVPGSGLLQNRNSDYISASFSSRNAYHAVFTSAYVSLRRTTSNRMSSLTINDKDNIMSSSSNVDNKGNQISANISVSKKVYDWHSVFSLDGNYEMLSNNLIRQNNIMKMNLNSIMGHLMINSNPLQNYLDITLDLTHNYSIQKLSLTSGSTHTNSSSANLKISSHPLKKLGLTASANYTRSDIMADKSKASFFVDCSAICHITDKIDLELAARNLANTKAYSYTYLRNSDIYSYSFALRPLEVLLSLKYTL